MKAIDIVNPEPRTELEAWKSWVSHHRGKFERSFGKSTRIEVKYIDKIDCDGNGRRYCEEQGEHSWFNHSMDNNLPDYPPGYKGDYYER